MSIRHAALAACLLASAPVAAASYSPEGVLPASGHVEHALYGFDVAPPSSSYRAYSWRRFTDAADARTTVLAIGMPGYDSYALSVMASSEVADSSAEIARRRASKLGFAPVDARRDCVMSDLDKPVRIESGMVAFLATCVDPDSKQVYELTLSWDSLIIALADTPRFRARAAQCPPGDFEPSGAEPCVDRLEGMRAAMRTFVASFRFASARS